MTLSARVYSHRYSECYRPKIQYLSVSRNQLIQVQKRMDDIGHMTDMQHIDTNFQSLRTRVTDGVPYALDLMSFWLSSIKIKVCHLNYIYNMLLN